MGNISSSSNINRTFPYIALCGNKSFDTQYTVLMRWTNEFLYLKDKMSRGISFKYEIDDEQLCDFLINEACNNFTTFFIASNFSHIAQVEYNEKTVDEVRHVILNLIKLMRNINNIEKYAKQHKNLHFP